MAAASAFSMLAREAQAGGDTAAAKTYTDKSATLATNAASIGKTPPKSEDGGDGRDA